MTEPVKHKQKIKGNIVSTRDKSAVVEVARFVKHPKYRKYFKKSKKYTAHDETGQRKIGETVVIESSRPLSGSKKWVIKN